VGAGRFRRERMGSAAYGGDMTRIVRLVAGAVLVLMGVVFTLQGLDVLGGSGMSGQGLWVVLGPIIALLGAYLLVHTLRTPPADDGR
jgi:hypothetical protein